MTNTVVNTYKDRLDPAFAGMIADNGPNDLFSRLVDEANGIGFAVPVVQGTNDNDCSKVSASTETVIGITVRDHSTVSDLFADNKEALLMRIGNLWVTVTDAGGVAADDEVWVAVADGTFSNADAGSNGSIKLSGCRWLTSAANGELAKIRVNLDVPSVAGAA